MSRMLPEDLSPDELAAQLALFRPLTQRVRDLVDAVIRTEVDEATLREVDADLEKLVARLQERQIEGGWGLRHDADGVTRAWGNAVIGVRNAVAPPLEVHRDPDGGVWAEFRLGAAYEGPPGLVHGGVTALILDHVLGQVAGTGGKPRMTASLTVTFRRGTPLGPLRVEARVERVDGRKTYAVGRLLDAEGVTAEAEGLFILPRPAAQGPGQGPAAQAPGQAARTAGPA